MNKIHSQWFAPPSNSPRQVLGAMVNTAREEFNFTVPAHVLGILTVVLEGQLVRYDARGALSEVPAVHATGSFSKSLSMTASAGSCWLSLFTRADTWTVLSGMEARNFTDQLFDPLTVLEGALPSTLRAGKTQPSVMAQRLLNQICVALQDHGQRSATAMLDAAFELLETRDIPELITAMGISERRLQRLFRAEIGLSAKQIQRMARLHRAVSRWNAPGRKERSIAELAHAIGYADQAHLARDFRLLAGQPALQLKKSESLEDGLLWALKEGGRLLAPGVFGRAPG